MLLYFLIRGVKLHLDQTLNGTERPQVQNIGLNLSRESLYLVSLCTGIDFFLYGGKMKPVIVALDVDNQEQLTKILSNLGQPQDVFIKIGMELFYHTVLN